MTVYQRLFNKLELVAKINTLLIRTILIFLNAKLIYSDIEIDFENYKVYKNTIELKLALIEFKILQIFLETLKKNYTEKNSNE